MIRALNMTEIQLIAGGTVVTTDDVTLPIRDEEIGRFIKKGIRIIVDNAEKHPEAGLCAAAGVVLIGIGFYLADR